MVGAGASNPHCGWEINLSPTSDTVSTVYFSRNYLTIQAQQISWHDQSLNPHFLKKCGRLLSQTP